MTTELRLRNQSQQLYVRALSAAWRNGVQLWDPSVWLIRDPDVEEKMLRDADISHAIGYRQRLIAGLQWAIDSRRDSPRGPMAIAVATELIEGIEDFTQSRFNLAQAFFSGERFAHIQGMPRKLKIGDGKERTWWCPTAIEDQDKRMFRIVPKVDGEQIISHWERWDIAGQKWVTQTVARQKATIRHVYNNDQGKLHHGSALREALGWWWYAKTHVLQESLQAVERFAQGILTAKVDGVRDATTGLPNVDLINAWRDVLEDLRARHVLVYDAADNIEVVSMDASGESLLSSVRDELKSTIFTLVLGANLTTGADKGGSYALADVQENSTESIISYDRQALEECLSRSLIGCLWWRNWANLVELGIADEKPRFSLAQEKRENPVERAQVAATLHGMGVPLALEELYEQTGFRRPEPGEDVLQQQSALQLAGGPGAPSGPGGMGNVGGALGGPLGDLGGLDDLGTVKDPFENLGTQFTAMARALLRFDQARVPAGSPEGGQFAPGEGSGRSSDQPRTTDTPAAAEKPSSKPSSKPAKEAIKPDATEEQATQQRVAHRAARKASTAINPSGDSTHIQHTVNGDGKTWSPERAAMHHEILADALAMATPTDKPFAHFMGGGPASGKSSLLKAGKVAFDRPHVLLDPDEFKSDLPEYRDGVAAKDPTIAARAHEESSYLTKQVAAAAAGSSRSVVWDGTGDNSIEALEKKVRQFHDAGYLVKSDYATIPTDEAIKRSNKRAERSGRKVPESVIRATHAAVSRIWPEAVKRGMFDESNLWDTTDRDPKLMASYKDGRLTIHEPEAYQAFLAKADQ